MPYEEMVFMKRTIFPFLIKVRPSLRRRSAATWKSCPISWKRWRRKYAMPYEEMVFMKRTIFPFLIKVRPSLRDSAFSLRFPAENFRTAKFSAGKTLRKRRDGRKRDSEGENCDRRSACATRKRTVREPLFMPYPGMRPLSKTATDVVHVRQGKELSGSPFSCRTPA